MSTEILLVEDNPDDAELTVRALREHNFLSRVTVARDGTEALSRLHPASGPGSSPYGLILLDLSLPKIDGLDVLRKLRADQRTALTPVVILTSSREQEDIITGYRCGANAYVRKPANSAEFADAVSTLGMFWLVLNEAPHRPPDTPARLVSGPYQVNQGKR